MHAIRTIISRELRGYFQTPIGYVFIVVFLLMSGAFTFYLGDYFKRGIADLAPFFRWHPWLYLFLVPAVSMRIWSEERRSGTIELLCTFPVSLSHIIIAKFLAAWLFIAIALAGTLPLWVTVNYLGNPDNGVIITAYLGSLLMAGAYLAIGCAMSAATKNQVIAFILTASVGLLFAMAGYGLVLSFLQSWAPQWLIDGVSSLSMLSNYDDISQGVVTLHALFYFASMMTFWLFITRLTLQRNAGE